jgi:hypothetical protein
MVTELTKKYVDTKGFDFLDFGASKVESLEYGKNHLFGKKGLGIDLDIERVKLMNRAGYDCVVADLTNLKLPAKSVKFVKMAHILEHMPDLKAVEKAVALAKHAATDFFVITGPFFDEDEYLKSKGFKLHWSDYLDHPCHLKVSELVEILSKLKLNNYEIYLRYPILNSSNPHVHTLASPPQSHQYDASIHSPKKHVKFYRLIWTDFVCYVQLRETKNWDAITKAFRDQIPYIEQKGKKQYVWSESAIKKFIEVDADNQKKDKRIVDLRAQRDYSVEKVSVLQHELSNIKKSKSWRTIRLLQKTADIIRRPVRLINRLGKQEFKNN